MNPKREEREEISESEFIFLAVVFLLGTAVMIPPGRAAGQESWLAIIIGAVEGGLFCLIYHQLRVLFPDKNLMSMLDSVFGKVFGKICGVLFLLYFLYVGSISLAIHHSFVELELLNKTPAMVVVILVLTALVYAVYSGIEVLARCGQMLLIICVLLFLVTFLLLFNEYNFSNLLPLFTVPTLQLLWSAQSTASFPFGEIVCFLMITDAVGKSSNSRKPRRLFLISLAISAVLLLCMCFRNIGVLGKLDQILIFPGFYLGRILHISESFTRMEIITIVNFIVLSFWKISLLLYVLSLGVSQLCNLRKHQRLIIPLALLMGFMALNNFQNMSQKITFLRFYYPIIALIFQLIFPGILLLTAKIKKPEEV